MDTNVDQFSLFLSNIRVIHRTQIYIRKARRLYVLPRSQSSQMTGHHHDVEKYVTFIFISHKHLIWRMRELIPAKDSGFRRSLWIETPRIPFGLYTCCGGFILTDRLLSKKKKTMKIFTSLRRLYSERRSASACSLPLWWGFNIFTATRVGPGLYK